MRTGAVETNISLVGASRNAASHAEHEGAEAKNDGRRLRGGAFRNRKRVATGVTAVAAATVVGGGEEHGKSGERTKPVGTAGSGRNEQGAFRGGGSDDRLRNERIEVRRG